MKAIATSRRKFPKRVCACGCRSIFQPVVEHQRYQSDSHRVMAYQERKFNKAVETAVQERLRKHAEKDKATEI